MNDILAWGSRVLDDLNESLNGPRQTGPEDVSAFLEVLTEHAAPFDLNDVLSDLGRAESLPSQTDPTGKFGDAPITVASDEFHSVSLLVWVTASTAIHDHGFDGAFTLASGSSVHVKYDWAEEEVLDADLSLGAVQPLGVERLTLGRALPILSGDGLIHSVCHVPAPTISVVVRNNRTASSVKPSVFSATGVRDRYLSMLGKKRSQAFRCALRTTPVDELKQAITLLNPDRLPSITFTLVGDAAYGRNLGVESLADLVQDTAELTAEQSLRLVNAMVSEKETAQLMAVRGMVRDAKARTLLGLATGFRGPELATSFARVWDASDDGVDLALDTFERLCDATPNSGDVGALGSVSREQRNSVAAALRGEPDLDAVRDAHPVVKILSSPELQGTGVP